MATSTTNLGLIKPAGTDKIRIAQINSNMDVIDTKMGAVGNTPLQTQITATNNALTTINNALRPSYQSWQENADSHDFTTTGVFLIGANPVNFPLPWGVLTVTANRPDTIFQLYEVSGQLYVQEYRGSTWSDWNSVLRANTIAIDAPGNTAPQAITSGQYVFWNRAVYTAKSNIASGATLSTSNLTAVSGGGLNALVSRSIKVKTVTVTIPANATSVSAAANPDSGFSFMCWLPAVPVRWAGLIWLGSYVNASVNVYTDTSDTSEREVRLAFIEKNY